MPNNLLELKGTLGKRKRNTGGGARSLPKGASLSLVHLKDLYKQLGSVKTYWHDKTLLGDTLLLEAYYTIVVAKSNRIKRFFTSNAKGLNDLVVGAAFYERNEGKDIAHVITYCMKKDALDHTLAELSECIKICNGKGWETITFENVQNLIDGKEHFRSFLTPNTLTNLLVDSYYVHSFKVKDSSPDQGNTEVITSLYDVGMPLPKILQEFGIPYLKARTIGEDTVLLSSADYLRISRKAPYLIAMSLPDLSTYERSDLNLLQREERHIAPPGNEATIGVIDTLFDQSAYFHEWVEYHNMLDPNIPVSARDTEHGTEIDSIIIDGPELNPDLADGCGHFRVRHFGVAPATRFSIFSIYRNIEAIVRENLDIKVWNLSLGSELEIKKSSISPIAALLDTLQWQYDIIFVIAGTNRSRTSKAEFIGSPADSINSLVVNSVSYAGKSAAYTRRGPVLSFFQKPDISCFGGDGMHGVIVSNGCREGEKSGTSFAAPWVARKLAYLIYNIGLSRETAKALLIDSAIGWTPQKGNRFEIGYGIIPIRIEDVLRTAKDETKFFIQGVAEKYDTYTYDLPVPMQDKKYPYMARAVLCYFPKTNRAQGVDYTNTELDLHFGRVKEDGQILTLNNNIQDAGIPTILYEENARTNFRKWDNVKIIAEVAKTRLTPKKSYERLNWGFSIKKKARLHETGEQNTPFALVISLKEMYGKDRHEEFIRLCKLKGWLVNEINIETRIEVINKAKTEEIIFE